MRTVDRPSPWRSIAKNSETLDSNRFGLQGSVSVNNLISNIYNIILLWGYVYFNLVPKIDFIIGDRSFEGSRRRHRSNSSSTGAKDPEILPYARMMSKNTKIIKLSQSDPRGTKRLPSSIRHGCAMVVVSLLSVCCSSSSF